MERICRTCNDERGLRYDVEMTGQHEEREISLVLCDDCAGEFDEVSWMTLAPSESGVVETEREETGPRDRDDGRE
jgi:hypothetical protein